MHHCTGKDEQALQPPDTIKQEAENAKFPILHEDFGDMFFFRTLRGVLKASGYPFFGLSDLHAPTPKRLRVQLSALINLAKFREEQLEFLEQLHEPVSSHLGCQECLHTFTEYHLTRLGFHSDKDGSMRLPVWKKRPS